MCMVNILVTSWKMSFAVFSQQFVKKHTSLLKGIDFWKAATPSKEKLASQPHDSKRCWVQQIYTNTWASWVNPKALNKKSAPQYDNRTRDLTSIWKSRHGMCLMMLHRGFGFGQNSEDIHLFFSTFWQLQVLKQMQYLLNYEEFTKKKYSKLFRNGEVIQDALGHKRKSIFSTSRSFLK